MSVSIHHNEEFWERVTALRAMPKLHELCSDPRHLFDAYYQVGDSEYVFASHQWDFAFTEQGMYVLSAIWSPSIAAFRRTTSRDAVAVTADDGATAPLPLALRLEADCTYFRAIRELAFSRPEWRAFELDIYDSRSWTAIGHVVRAGCFSYHFRSPAPVPADELPFAVKCDTRHDPHGHWPCGGVEGSSRGVYVRASDHAF